MRRQKTRTRLPACSLVAKTATACDAVRLVSARERDMTSGPDYAAPMGKLALVAVTALCSCSLGMKTTSPGWTGETEPDCSTSPLPIIGDALVSGVGLAIALAGIESQNDAMFGVGMVVGGVFGIGAAIGEVQQRRCERQIEAWQVGTVIGTAAGARIAGNGAALPPNEEHQRARLALETSRNPKNDPNKAAMYWCARQSKQCVAVEDACSGECFEQREVWCAFGDGRYLCASSRDACLRLRNEQRARTGECVTQRAVLTMQRAPTPTPRMVATNPPRGWFCTSSPSRPEVGSCTRDKLDCERARDVVVPAVPDMTACALVEHAHCFGAGESPRCAPSPAACAAQLERSGQSATCQEAK